MKILICGGAGYIGSHMTLAALDAGHEVVVVDNLSTGHEEAVPEGLLHVLDIGDFAAMQRLLSVNKVDLVMHFSASSLVGESMENPGKYYENNVGGTLSLLAAMLETGHNALVFSSTAAVYGEPQSPVITESHPTIPINPYGRSKLMVENILQDYSKAYGLNSVCLRYFNAAGADLQGRIGESHDPETHLIPNILKSAASGGDAGLEVFGLDYPTRDGTCERDYIHVNDLAGAHLKAGEYLVQQPGAHVFNLGNGVGYTVLEIIEAARKVTGCEIEFESCPPRAGDPPSLVADISRVVAELGWSPRINKVDELIATAWQWHQHESFRLD